MFRTIHFSVITKSTSEHNNRRAAVRALNRGIKRCGGWGVIHNENRYLVLMGHPPINTEMIANVNQYVCYDLPEHENVLGPCEIMSIQDAEKRVFEIVKSKPFMSW